jgi:hypothetical protein
MRIVDGMDLWIFKLDLNTRSRRREAESSGKDFENSITDVSRYVTAGENTQFTP